MGTSSSPRGGKPRAPDPEERSETSEDKHLREYQEAVAELGNLSAEQLLAMGQEALLRDLVALVQAGKASAAEKAVLRALLRDNGLTMAPEPKSLKPTEEPADLPDLGRPDWL